MFLYSLDFSNIPVLEMLLFSFVVMATPGPVNTLLVASGLIHGGRATMPAALVAPFGVIIHVVVVGVGLGDSFEAMPQLKVTLQIIGSIYILYLAYKIAFLNKKNKGDEIKGFFHWRDAFMVSFLSPKSFINASVGVSLFSVSENYLTSIALFAFFYWSSAIIANTFWIAIGKAIGVKVKNPAVLARINYGLGFLLFVVVFWMNKDLFY